MSPEHSRTLFQQCFAAEMTELPRIKTLVLDALGQAGWCGDDLGRFELVLEEGVVNIVTYAYPGKSGEVMVTLSTIEGGVLLRLEDTGIPFDPVAVPAPDLDAPADDRPLGGQGVYLMKQLSSGVAYRREMEKNVLDVVMKRTLN